MEIQGCKEHLSNLFSAHVSQYGINTAQKHKLPYQLLPFGSRSGPHYDQFWAFHIKIVTSPEKKFHNSECGEHSFEFSDLYDLE